jgi:hypothetical protein
MEWSDKGPAFQLSPWSTQRVGPGPICDLLSRHAKGSEVPYQPAKAPPPPHRPPTHLPPRMTTTAVPRFTRVEFMWYFRSWLAMPRADGSRTRALNTARSGYKLALRGGKGSGVGAEVRAEQGPCCLGRKYSTCTQGAEPAPSRRAEGPKFGMLVRVGVKESGSTLGVWTLRQGRQGGAAAC